MNWDQPVQRDLGAGTSPTTVVVRMNNSSRSDGAPDASKSSNFQLILTSSNLSWNTLQLSDQPMTFAEKVESRLSILALLAPSSPESPPHYHDYLGYQHQILSTPSPPVQVQPVQQVQQIQQVQPVQTIQHIERSIERVSPQQQLQIENRQDAASAKAAKFHALLPRPSDLAPPPTPSAPASRSSASLPRRMATIVACENCRAKRTKVC